MFSGHISTFGYLLRQIMLLRLLFVDPFSIFTKSQMLIKININLNEFRTAPLLPDCCCVLADWSCLELLFVLTERHPFDAYVKHVASHLIERMKDYDVALTILIIQVLIFAEYFCYPD